MLPYLDEPCRVDNDTHCEKIKKCVSLKIRRDQDIDIEKIVKYDNLDVSIIFYGNVEALGDKIDPDKIKRNIFTNVKKQYSMNDIVKQKIYQLYYSDKTGMISYMGLDTFSDNIGYNEYPVQFEIIQTSAIDDFPLSFSFGPSSTVSQFKDFNAFNGSTSSLSTNQTIGPNKSISSKQVVKKFITKKSVNFEDSNNNTNNNNKGTNTLKTKKTKGGGILKNSKKNLPIMSINENIEKKPIEEADFLSKFKETLKKVDIESKGENNYNISNNLEIRKSTLRDGILYENDKDSSDNYEEEEN
jgi:hypothetical protein